MKAKGILFEARQYRGTVTPPASLEDVSRWGNDGVFTTAPTWTRLPSRLWYLDFVAASSQLVTIGDIGKAKTLVFWVNLDSTTESILEELAANGILANAGAMVYANWDNCFIDGVDTDTITASVWHQVAITSTTDVTMSAFRLGLVNVTYLDGGIAHPIVFAYELSHGQINKLFEAERRFFGV